MVIETQIHHSEHFEDWMNAGAAAIGAQSTKTGNWSVQLKDSQGHVKTFANLKSDSVLTHIPQSKLDSLLEPVTPSKMITEFPHTFDECMALDGVEIVDAHHLSKHSHRFAAHIFVPRLGVKSFTNLSSIHLSQHFDLDHLRIQEEFIPLKPSSPGHSFVECMARGAKIVDGHQTPSGRFAIHVEMGHGQRKSFSNLSAEKIVPYHSVSDWQTNRN